MESIGTASLSPKKERLLSRLLANQGTQFNAFPLSFAQQRLWFLDRLTPGQATYHIPVAVRLRGTLSLDALAWALRELTIRHEVLRTRVATVDGQAMQVVGAADDVRPPVTPVDGEHGLAALLVREHSQAFDLEKGPLWRAHVLRLAADDHVLHLTLHHLIADGWSMGVLVRDLTTLYEARVAGATQSPLPRLAVQYADYAVWQRAWLNDGIVERQLAFWRGQLAGMAPLDLPTDFPRPAIASQGGGRSEFVVPSAVVSCIRALGREEGTTLFMTLLAAWQVVLQRWTGQMDICVGAAVANRPRQELEALIGMFANTLVLRSDLNGDPSFRTLLRRVRATTLDAYAHQDVPFERVVDALRPERTLRHAPLVDVMFVLQNATAPVRRGGAIAVEPVVVEVTSAKFDLTLTVLESGNELHGALEYRADLFGAATADRVVEWFVRVLDQVTGAADRRLSDVDLTSREEHAQLLAWAATSAPFPATATVHGQFAAQARRTPAAVAVIGDSGVLTYAAVAEQATAVAAALRAAGVGAESCVGVCIDDSRVVSALLGVLAAGGAYVPLDSADPVGRWATLVQATPLQWVVTTNRWAGAVRAAGATPLLLESMVADGTAAALDATDGDPAQLAYVLFTSGSTGPPKAVGVPHQAIVRLVSGSDAGTWTGRERVLLHSPLTFDASTWELWGPLLHGGRCVWVPSVEKDVDALARVVREHAITTMWLTASVFAVVMELAPDALAGVETLIVGGEAVPPLAVRRAHAVLPTLTLINGYGPTEGTTFSCCGVIPQMDADAIAVPLGRPIANTQAFVLDVAGRLAPVGVPGELYLGGAGLARAYLGRPGFTAERFVPDGISGTLGARLYRTGDRVRWLADGTLAFLGRLDDQVKIRGFRIEPGEVEAVLRGHPGIAAAVVVPTGATKQKRLAAYWVARDPLAPPDVDSVRAHVAAQLPSHLVPAFFEALDALPLTATGKVDRRRLPAPSSARPMLATGYVAPVPGAETTLAAIWAGVLGVERVGAQDNFFALGGDSILSIQVAARAAQAGIAITPRQLFEQQTVAGLAAVAGAQKSAVAPQGLVTGDVPATPIVRWWLEAAGQAPHHFNQAVLLTVREPLVEDALATAVGALLAHHDALRLRLTRDATGWQLSHAGQEALTPLPVSRVAWNGDAASLTARATTVQAGFDLARGPLLQVVWFDAGAAPGRLLIVSHHLAIDGVSWRILLADLATAYRHAAAGRAVVLPPKTTSYKQWAEHLVAEASHPAVLAELPYWTAAGMSGCGPRLGTDGDVASSGDVSWTLSAAETALLVAEVATVYRTTVEEALVAALAQALGTATESLRIDIEGHGREPRDGGIDLTRTVGWHTSIYPVALPVATDAEATLLAVKDTLRRVPQRGLGYGVLRYLSPAGAVLRSQPPAVVVVNYLGQVDTTIADDRAWGAAAEAVGPDRDATTPARYPLAVSAIVAGGQLRVQWAYRGLPPGAVVTRAAAMHTALQHIVARATKRTAWAYTPADFPLVDLPAASLLRIVGEDRRVDGRPRRVEEVAPLSPLQQGLLFHSLYAPAHGVYLEQVSCQLNGAVDLDALAGAWEQVVARHPILRTRFVWDGVPAPVQVVETMPPATITIESGATARDAAAWAEWLAADRLRGFDLQERPPVRLALFPQGTHGCHVVWTFHHLLLDGWSVAVVLDEWRAAYAAARNGQLLARPTPRPYRDYLAWIVTRVPADAETFWRGRLAGFSAPTLIADRSLAQDARVDEMGCELSEEAFAHVEAFARERRLTLNTLVQGAWALLLGQYSGSTDVVFGATVAGRPPELSGVEAMVGLFINTVPIRTQLPPDAAVDAWLQRLQDEGVRAREYEHSPLVEVQTYTDVARGTPLFDSVVVFENYPLGVSRDDVGDLAVTDRKTVEPTNYALTVVASARRTLSIRLLYRPSAMSDGRARRVLEGLTRALSLLTTAGGARLGALMLVPDADRTALLSWSAASRELPDVPTVAERFAAHVTAQPGAIAVSDGEERLTYAELDRRARQVTGLLRASGVRPDTLVAVYVERSTWLVAALLGIVKAGGAYVPIDPDYPADRVGFVIRDAAAPVVVTEERFAPIAAATGATVITVEQAARAVPDREGVAAVAPDQLAYVIYTSGSTGTPKGVMVTHRNIARLFDATSAWFAFAPDDVWTMFHSAAFDFSVWELWGALAFGGRIVIVPTAVARSPATFCDLLVREGVTVLNQTPSAFALLADVAVAQQARLALRYVIFGGEALQPARLGGWLRHYGAERPRLVNMYGITETTVHVTYMAIDDAAVADGTSIIGGPMSDLSTYVLDASGRLSPAGVDGELYVGGAGVARGYLARPGLTAERFVPDAFGPRPGARLYRSGDRTRWRSDRTLEYRGRVDAQVKIRGVRIEPGEIERALLAHPDVGAAVVVARSEGPAARLVAYWVARNEGTLTSVSQLRDWLADRLPPAYVPALFVELTALPQTPSGKVDRRALPSVDAQRPELAIAYAPPRTHAETLLAQAWAEVLGVDRVGVHDNYFALGGDSIRSIQVQTLARSRGLDFSLPQLFERPTVAELAAVVSAVGATPAPLAAVSDPLHPEDRARLPADVENAYPLTMLQSGMLFHGDYHAHAALYHDVFTYRLGTPLATDALQKAVASVTQRHPVLRTSIHLSRFHEPIQCVHRSVVPAVAVEDLSGLPEAGREEALSSWLARERVTPFDYQQPSLIRWFAHRWDAAAFQFTVSFHHAILDGWSLASLLTEVFQEYTARAAAVPPPQRRPPTASFAEYVALERAALASAHVEAFWRAEVDDATPALLDGDGSGAASLNPCTRLVPIADEIADALRRTAESSGVSLKTVLLAAHLRVMACELGRHVVTTGVVMHGRPETGGGDEVLGLFLNTVPFRLRVPSGSWRDLVDATARRGRDLLPYSRYPLARVQQAAGGQPLFDTIFNFTHFHVYNRVRDAAGIPVLSGAAMEQTNFTFAANFTVDAAATRVLLRLDYDGAAIAEDRAAAIAETYARALERLATAPDSRCDAMALLSDAERARAGASATTGGLDNDDTVVERFEAQVRLHPENIAVRAGHERLNYADVNRRANQLAHELRARGVRAETLVGVELAPSMLLPVVVIAVWKAGGVYVPIDPQTPSARVIEIARDVGVAVIIRDADRAALPLDVQVLAVSPNGRPVRSRSRRNPGVYPLPASAAYVIHTSGSSGRPKVVAVAHGALNNMTLALARLFEITDSSRVLQAASVAFDASVFEVATALTTGAALHVVDRSALGGTALAAVLEREAISVMTLPPSVLATVPASGLPDLRTVVAAGEACPAPLAERWSRSRRFFNAYGPTETAVCATAAEVCEPVMGRVPIGRPIANARVYVTDDRGGLVRAGVPGELYIGGAGVARGYIGQPALTAERFVPDAFSGALGQRLYRTGDRVRWTRSGELEFLGRVDEQLKIRGFRVEPGEVEAALIARPGVAAAAVVAIGEGGDRRLVAYWTARHGAAAPTAEALLKELRSRLPSYLVPATLTELPSLPVTRSGKVDRRALALRAAATPTPLATLYVAPRTPVEASLAELWGGVLGRERVGVDDDFFALGGHSLAAMQIAAQIRDVWQGEVSVRTIMEQPTIAKLAGVLDARTGAPMPEIARRSASEPAPLSFAQQRLWFLEQLAPGEATYHMPLAVRVRGALNVEALHWALQQLVDRHDVLRTRIATVADGQPVQVVEPHLEVELPVSIADGEAAALTLLADAAVAPFDFGRGPLWRAHLVRLADDDQVLHLTLHHAIADGWSMGVLVQEIGALYRERVTGGATSPLPALRVQYADYAAWQRAWLTGEVLETQIAYWRRQLADVPVLALPTDHPRPPVVSSRGGHVGATVPAAVVARARAIARQEGSTLFMILLAAWQVVLHRWTGQDDVSVGTPMANRPRPELEALIGMFVNTLVLRSDFRGNPTWREVLQHVRATTLGAYAHQDVPFERLVETLQPARDLRQTPLFQVMFVLQHAPMEALDFGGVALEPVTLANQVAKFDLTLAVTETAGELRGALEYRTDLFTEATAARLVEWFARVLADATERPDDRVSDLSLLLPSERAQLAEWGESTCELPATTVLDCFEHQAATTPDAVAVVDGRDTTTYRDLDAWSTAIAHRLRAAGVGAGDLVAVWLERSAAAVAAALGVLKLGAAYVPLDPELPTDRMKVLVGDTAIRAVVTREGWQDYLPAGTSVVHPERAPGGVTVEGLIRASLAPLQIAYAIFTSGSTGRPKAVALTHRGLMNLVSWHQRTYGVTAASRAALVASPGFDAAVWELWPYLAIGASVAVAGDVTRDPSELAAWAAAQELTHMFVPTPLAEAMLGVSSATAAPEWLLTGGDVLHQRPSASCRSVVVNHYGPTEATVVATAGIVDRIGTGAPAIGRPIANTRAYVIDAGGQLALIGVPGELYLGGVGLAQGYIGRPGATAERFVPDSVSGTSGARLYRTGDRVRWAADGMLEFVGRLDDQVKIRGVRIELAEVEAALRAHPEVAAAAVVASGMAPQKRLVAYWVARASNTAPAAEALRAYMTTQLPAQLVPAVFEQLDALPLTSSGKVDRARLPAVGSVRSECADHYIAPVAGVEHALADIWAGVLGVERIGAHDNFFALGGDSILSIQVVARAAEAGIRITPRQLFEQQTVAGLAAVAATAPGERGVQDLVTGAVPLTPVVHWWLSDPGPSPHHFNQSVLVSVRQPLVMAAFETAMREVLARHDALRLRLIRDDGRWRLWQAGAEALTPMPLARIEWAGDAATLTAAATAVQASLDLGAGPLVRVVWFDGGTAPGRLLVVIHHLAVDGVSWRILLDDLGVAYHQAVEGRPVVLPPKTTSLQRWASQLEAYAARPDVLAELPYWTAVGARGRDSFPRAIERADDGEPGEVTWTLTEDETRGLVTDAGAIYRTTVEEALLAALAHALGRANGAHEIRVDVEGHGREPLDGDVDLTRTVGWFTTVWPAVLPVSGTPDATLLAVKDTLRQVPHRGLGYGVLRYLSPVGGALLTQPAAPVLVNYLGQVDAAGDANPLWGTAAESAGPDRDPAAPWRYPLVVTGIIAGGRLRVHWTHSGAYPSRLVAAWADAMLASLRQIVTRAGAGSEAKYTPSDFSDMPLDDEQLERILRQVSPFNGS